MDIHHKLGGMLLAMLLVLYFTIRCSAADNVAHTIAQMTGWDAEDVQAVLKESFTDESQVTQAKAEASFLGDMRAYAADFVDCQVKLECIATISALETGHFRYTPYNNIGGIMGASGYVRYDSIPDGIRALDTLLWEQYLTPGGMYYEDGTTVLEITKHYNTSIEWLALYVDVRLSMQERMNQYDEQCRWSFEAAYAEVSCWAEREN